MINQDCFRTGFMIIWCLLTPFVPMHTEAQIEMSNNYSDTAKVDNIHWITAEFGIGNGIEFSKTSTKERSNSFRFGKEFKKPAFVGSLSNIQDLKKFVDDFYTGIIDSAKDFQSMDYTGHEAVNYEYFVHDSIFSLLMTHLKSYPQSEGTTNYALCHVDLKHQVLLSTKLFFEAFGLSQIPVLAAFAEQCVWPDESNEPLFDPHWFETIRWGDLNLLKIYVDDNEQVHIIYPLATDGSEGRIMLK